MADVGKVWAVVGEVCWDMFGRLLETVRDVQIVLGKVIRGLNTYKTPSQKNTIYSY